MTLLVIAIVSCCGDYGSATGSIAIVPQAGQWHISPNTVNHVSIPGARFFQFHCNYGSRCLPLVVSLAFSAPRTTIAAST